MVTDSTSLCVISSFNTANLAAMLMKHPLMSGSRVTSAPYGLVHECLLDANQPCWADDPRGALVWTHPSAVSRAFDDLLAFADVSADRIMAEVDEFADAVCSLAGRLDWVLLPTWTLPPHWRGYGMLDMANGMGHANALARMNLRLADRFQDMSNVYLLDAGRWVSSCDRRAYDARLWYMGKIPFGDRVFKIAVEEIAAACQGLEGMARKLIILDLDDTLWGGIVGDEGWENVRLGGHDPVGEAFADFQRGLKSLTARGILLAIASKNDERVALDAIESHPEMVLAKSDFVAWRINWSDKAANIVDLVRSVNLGLQSTVFIDDNPVERARVRDALPEVLVPEWPADKTRYVEALKSLTCFDAPIISKEDRERAIMYAQEQERAAVRAELPSIADWIASLQMKIRVKELDKANLPRAAQLLNKTNQMNMKTRRMSESELWAWSEQELNHFFVFRVQDRYGDSGLTGLLGLAVEDGVGHVTDFVLSCRVMGRGVEQTMLHVLVDRARAHAIKRLEARFIPTARNGPCREYWTSRSGFSPEDGDVFSWDPAVDYEMPSGVELIGDFEPISRVR